jgi:DNA-binding transcriptional LysR family regulator
MLPDLNRLRVFYYIYSRKSIVAASGELHITPSAVSQHLQKLESEIKTPLFTRLHKRLVPTIAGERLFGLVRPFMADLAPGIDAIRQARETPAGPLRIGAPPEFGAHYFPGIFASFRQSYPEVVFYLKLGDPATLLPMVSRGDLDFAFVDMFPVRGQVSETTGPFSIEPIIEEEVVLAGSRQYYNRHVKDDKSYAHLAGMSFIAFRPHALEPKNWFRHHFQQAPARLNVVLTVASHRAAVNGIRHHQGLGVIASHMAWEAIARGELVPITTAQKPVMNRISLVQLQDKVPSLGEKAFVAHFRKEIHQTGILKNFRLIPGT